jgi:hypothetical protein
MQDPGGGTRVICPRLHSFPPHSLLRARIAEAADRNESKESAICLRVQYIRNTRILYYIISEFDESPIFQKGGKNQSSKSAK